MYDSALCIYSRLNLGTFRRRFYRLGEKKKKDLKANSRLTRRRQNERRLKFFVCFFFFSQYFYHLPTTHKHRTTPSRTQFVVI